MDENQLLRVVSGAVRLTIQAHGPITKDFTPSASKRIACAIHGAVVDHLRYESAIDPTDRRVQEQADEIKRLGLLVDRLSKQRDDLLGKLHLRDRRR